MFFLYNVLKNQNRRFRLNNVPSDTTSLTNITHLVRQNNSFYEDSFSEMKIFSSQVSDAISQTHADILEFTVIQADIVEASATLNVTVLVSLKPQCLSDCQRLQINKLTILTVPICAPITLAYDGNIYDYNASLTGKFYSMIIKFLPSSLQCRCLPWSIWSVIDENYAKHNRKKENFETKFDFRQEDLFIYK